MYTLTVGLAAAQMNYAQTSGLGYPDGAGGVRLDPDLHRLHRLPEADRARDGRDGGAMKRIAAALLRRAGARQLRAGRRQDAHLSAALLRRMRRRIWRQHRRRQGGRRVRDHHHADQPLQRREPRHHDRRQRRRLARLSAADRANGGARPARPRDDARRRDLRLCGQGAARAGRAAICRRPASARRASPTRARAGVTIGGHIYGLPWDTHGGLFHVNTALFAKAGLMRGGKPVLPDSRGGADRPGAAVRAAHRQALSDPEQRRRSGLRRAQPLHLHDGAGRGAVPRSASTSA